MTSNDLVAAILRPAGSVSYEINFACCAEGKHYEPPDRFQYFEPDLSLLLFEPARIASAKVTVSTHLSTGGQFSDWRIPTR